MTAQLPEPDLNYMQRVLLEMLAIPSPTGFTDTIVRYVAERLTELGIPFELTRRGTIRATLKGRRYSPDRAVAAHLDTIGHRPRDSRYRPPGPGAVGCWSSRFAEGSRVSVFTDTGDPRQRLAAAGLRARFQHRGGRGSGQLGPRRTAPGRLHLQPQRDLCPGVNVGDFVAFDPMPEFTESGYISARHLDDKAGVAALLAALKAIVESGREPPIDVHPLFTITEETGSGAAGALPWDVSEFVGIDIAPAAKGQASSEHAVTVAMQDSGGPYDFHLSRHLLKLATEHEIPVRRDLFRYYHSDAQSAVEAGHDIRTALLAFGCDATHGYERTHIDSLAAMSRLLCGYMLSQPVFASDAQHAKDSLERFSHQLEHDAQMENDTRVPPVDTLIGRHSNPQERNS